jgi:hypothetical protein
MLLEIWNQLIQKLINNFCLMNFRIRPPISNNIPHIPYNAVNPAARQKLEPASAVFNSRASASNNPKQSRRSARLVAQPDSRLACRVPPDG